MRSQLSIFILKSLANGILYRKPFSMRMSCKELLVFSSGSLSLWISSWGRLQRNYTHSIYSPAKKNIKPKSCKYHNAKSYKYVSSHNKFFILVLQNKYLGIKLKLKSMRFLCIGKQLLLERVIVCLLHVWTNTIWSVLNLHINKKLDINCLVVSTFPYFLVL